MLKKNIIDDFKFSPDGPGKDLVVGSENFKIMRISLKSGMSIPSHKGSHPVFFLVIKGSGIFITGEGEVELRENESIYLEPEEPRGIKSLEDLIVLAVRN